MGGVRGWFVASAVLVALTGCDQGSAASSDGLRECSAAQWSRVTSGGDLIEPVSCESVPAQWDGADAAVIRVEHNVQCQAVCTAAGCSEQQLCPSEIATIADDGEQLRWISNVARYGDTELGARLEPALGFDPAAISGIVLEEGASMAIVERSEGLCLQVAPLPPLSGHYTDCGGAMAEIELDYVDGVLPFDRALELADPPSPPSGQWDSGNLAFAFDRDDTGGSRWTFVVHGRAVGVDMQGNVFRGDH